MGAFSSFFHSPPKGVTRRAILLAAILVIANAFLMVYRVYILRGDDPTVQSLLLNAVFVVFLLALLNSVLRRRGSRFALSQGELLTVYVLLSLGTALNGIGMLQVLPAVISYPFWHATPENRWTEFLPHLPSWLTVQDRPSLEGLYVGRSSFFLRRHFLSWLTPILWWTGFTLALIVLLGCLASLLRRRWAEEEKLPFPIIQLPLELSAVPGQLLASKAFWTGFIVCVGLLVLSIVHGLVPAVPAVPFHWDFTTSAVGRPWGALRWKVIYWYPSISGLAFLMPVEMLFSMWFFNFFWKAQVLLTAQYSPYEAMMGQPPFLEEQLFGAYLGVAAMVLWLDRGYLKGLLKEAIFPTASSNHREALSPRAALFGLALAFGFMLFFCHRGGMSYWSIFLFFAIYLALAITVARVRAQLGSPVHDLHYSGPEHVLSSLVGSRRLRSAELGMFSLFWWFNRDYRPHPMPHLLEGLKLAEGGRMEPKRLIGPVLVITAIATLTYLFAYLTIGYRLGAETPRMWAWTWWPGWEVGNRFMGWLTNPQGTNVGMAWAAGWGLVSTIGLMALRVRIPGWPLHPVGYALAGSLAADAFLVPFFIAWLAKSLILRYGGLRAYRVALNVVFGLIMGEAAISSLRPLAAFLLGVRALPT